MPEILLPGNLKTYSLVFSEANREILRGERRGEMQQTIISIKTNMRLRKEKKKRITFGGR